MHALFQNILNKKVKKLYGAFIDYQMAFDTVIRDALWIKLTKSGVSCKMSNILKSLYNSVKACVKLSATAGSSDFFDISLGLKQGKPLSQMLFTLFINACLDLTKLY